ncbi:septum site-determining protein Ssd [Symbioplanes lichenis]|uniref:septum site-determining protein Ssd n=1 Tax=Symbioplanes lichenis TaxID=1629072 RepID=UPI002738A603|nr:septum site-determining protein Ssd [Actinoplanes lichenis]
MTADQHLLDDLLRLAAAGGVEAHVAPDPVAARAHYRSAPLVIVGADQVVACGRAGLPRRDKLIVAGYGAALDPLWELARGLGAEHVALLPQAEPWLVDRFGEQPGPPPQGRVVAFVGGRGGAGTSTLATGLAVTAVRARLRTLLLDADPLGGGLDLILGWERRSGLRWSALAEAGPGFESSALLESLPADGDLVLLSFARDALPGVPGEVMAVTLTAARKLRDLTVVDLPRHLDDAAVLALQSVDEALLIVPADLRAVAAAGRIAATVRLHCEALSVVVRGNPGASTVTAREVARSLGLPLAAQVRHEPALCDAVERREPPAATGRGPFADSCRDLLALVTARTTEAVA